MVNTLGTSVRAFVASGCLALALTSHGSRAHAGSPNDRVVAESLFDEGRKLLDDGKLEEACAKLDASNRLDPAVGTLLNLGDCNERRGRIATAWSNYRAAGSLALTRGDAARAEFARKRSEAVQSRLSTLTVVVTTPEPGLRVTRDGVLVEDAALGAALPIDPGTHVIEAQAPGKKTWTSKVTVAPGAPSSASVKIEPLVTETAPTTPTASPTARAAPAGPPGEGGNNLLRTLGFVGVGVGAAAIGAGVYFALRARSLWSDGQPHCDASYRCDDVGFMLNHDARRSGDFATATLTAGLVVAAAGTLAILFAPGRSLSSPSPTRASTASTGFSLTGDGARFGFHVP